MVARPGGAAVFLLLPRTEVPIPVSSPPLFPSIFLLLVLSSLSLFFSSILSLYSSVLFSLFFSFSLCFLLFSIFLFFLSIPYIYRQKTGGERPTTPVQSWHRGGVVGAALCSHPEPPEGHITSVFHPVVGHGSEFRQVGVFGQRLFGAFGERRTGEKQGSKSFFFPYLTRLGEEEDPQ